MKIGEFNIDVVVDLTKMNAQMAQARAAAAPLQKSLEDVKAASAGATQAANTTAASVKKLEETAKQTTQSTRSLVQTMNAVAVRRPRERTD